MFDRSRYEIISAGIEAHGLNPKAVASMAQVGIDISMQESKTLTPAMLQDISLVVTVCGDAGERCPVLQGRTKKIHWPLPDPAKLEGSEEEIAQGFARIRDDIRRRVAALADEFSIS